MIVLLELFTIIAYLFSNTLGFVIAIIMFLSIWTNKKESVFNKIILSLILSSPIFQTSIIGDPISHLLSWFNIFMIIFIVYLIYNFIKGRTKISILSATLIGFALSIIVITSTFSENYRDNYLEFMQLVFMVIPILMVYQQRKYLTQKINEKDKKKWVKYINISLVSTVIATLIQYFAYTKFKITVGNVTIFNSRSSFDFLFMGYSVLSMYLGIGVVLNMIIFWSEHKLYGIIMVIVCLLGIMINSSRTGLIVSALISIVITVSKSKKSLKNFTVSIAIIIIGMIAFLYAAKFILRNRTIDGLFNDNGRIETYKHGLQTINSSLKNFLFGIGLSHENYDFTWPHNFIIQSTLTMGIIATSIWIISIFYILKYINRIDFKYVLWYIFVASMFITSFQAMSFITLYISIGILLVPEKEGQIENKYIKEKEENNEKSISNYGNVQNRTANI